MGMPEDIPEDREVSYHCDICKIGSIAFNPENGTWDCDTCDFCANDDNGT